MTQKDRVWQYLKYHGKINPLQAWTECGCYRLSSVIHRLRKEGKSIKTELTDIKNQFDENIEIATYYIEWI